jgi:hypothetical protein
MLINRRRFLQIGGAFAGAVLLPGTGRTQERFIAAQGPWRKFDITTALKFTKPKGRAQAWIPVPAVNADDWARALGSDWETNAKVARLDRDEASGVELVYLEWDENETAAAVQISSHAETRDRITDFTRPTKAEPLSGDDRSRYTAPVSFMPHDGWLRETATKITENAKAAHLEREGVNSQGIHFVGNPMIDTLLRFRGTLDLEATRQRFRLPERYAVATLHRPSNVDVEPAASYVVEGLRREASQIRIVLPLHPRGRENVESKGL